MSARAGRSRELRGGHVLAMLVLFFGAVIAINVGFAVMAMKTFPGEEEAHSYVQGLHYNDTLAERHAQAGRGWRAGAVLRAVDHGAELEIALRTPDGPITDALITGELERPTDSRLDRPLRFNVRGEGLYVATLRDLPPGEWRLRARAMANTEAFDFERSFTWRHTISP